MLTPSVMRPAIFGLVLFCAGLLGLPAGAAEPMPQPASACRNPEKVVEHEKRIAFLLGNQNYRDTKYGSGLKSLRGPVNDVNLMARHLCGLGFEIFNPDGSGTAMTDYERRDLAFAMPRFVEKVKNESYDVVFVYISSHGGELELPVTDGGGYPGKPVIFPTDFPARYADSALDWEASGFPAWTLIDELAAIEGLRTVMIVLDMCRTQPLPATGSRDPKRPAYEPAYISRPAGLPSLLVLPTAPERWQAPDVLETNFSPAVMYFDEWLKPESRGRLAGQKIGNIFYDVAGKLVRNYTRWSGKPMAVTPYVSGGKDNELLATDFVLLPELHLPGEPFPRPPTSSGNTDIVSGLLSVPATRCDYLAGDPLHPDRPAGVAGVDFVDIKAGEAIRACREAAGLGAPRLRYALARSYLRLAYSKEQDKAGSGAPDFRLAYLQFRELARAGDPFGYSGLSLFKREGYATVDFGGQPLEGARVPQEAIDFWLSAGALGLPQQMWLDEGAKLLGANDLGDRTRLKSELEGLAKGVRSRDVEAGTARPVAYLALAQVLDLEGSVGPAISAAREGLAKGAPGAEKVLAGLLQRPGRSEAEHDEALKLHQDRAAEDQTAFADIGDMYRSGVLGKADLKAAFDAYERAPNTGYALWRAGRAYLFGEGTKPDREMAVRRFGQAIEKGERRAYAALAEARIEDLKTASAEDLAETLDLLNKGHEAGDPAATEWLGWRYERGYGVAPDVARAIDYYEIAARAGLSWSAHRLGCIYLNGWGVAVDEARALDWYLVGARLGRAESYAQLGWQYREGKGVPRNDGIAFLAYKQAVGRGNISSSDELAAFYLEGRGRPRDMDQGLAILDEAVAKGDAFAMIARGRQYLLDGPAGKAKALDLFDKAAADEQMQESCCTDRLVRVAILFAEGKGGAQEDLVLARRYFNLAAGRGNEWAMRWLATLDGDEGEAAEQWLAQAAGAGSADAAWRLAQAVDRRGETAAFEIWRKKAADLGSLDAMVSLGYSERSAGRETDWLKTAAEKASGADHDFAIYAYAGDLLARSTPEATAEALQALRQLLRQRGSDIARFALAFLQEGTDRETILRSLNAFLGTDRLYCWCDATLSVGDFKLPGPPPVARDDRFGKSSWEIIRGLMSRDVLDDENDLELFLKRKALFDRVGRLIRESSDADQARVRTGLLVGMYAAWARPTFADPTFRSLADGGNDVAMVFAADLADTSDADAQRYYEGAAAAGIVTAIYDLAVHHRDGIRGASRDHDKARELFQSLTVDRENSYRADALFALSDWDEDVLLSSMSWEERLAAARSAYADYGEADSRWARRLAEYLDEGWGLPQPDPGQSAAYLLESLLGALAASDEATIAESAVREVLKAYCGPDSGSLMLSCYSVKTREALQALLREKGTGPGKSDGKIGDQTILALMTLANRSAEATDTAVDSGR